MIRSYLGSATPSSLQPIMPCLIYPLLQNYFTRVSVWTLNGIWSFLRPCIRAGSFPLKRVKDSPAFTSEMFHLGFSFNKRQENEEAFFQKHSWSTHVSQCFLVSHMGNIVSSVSFCFQDANYALRYMAGNSNKNPSMWALAKILWAWASEHSSNFCEQFEQMPNFVSTFKLDGTIWYPSYSLP